MLMTLIWFWAPYELMPRVSLLAVASVPSTVIAVPPSATPLSRMLPPPAMPVDASVTPVDSVSRLVMLRRASGRP